MAEEIKIVVGADTSKLQAELKKAESELKAFQTQLNNTGDSKKIDELNKKIAETKNIISNLKTQLPPIDITADNTQLIAQIKKSEDELKILQGYASQVKITADASQLDATFLKAEAELKAIGSSISLIDIKADATQIDSTIKKVENELINLKAIPIPITADANQLVSDVNKAKGAIENIPPVLIPISADNTELLAQVSKAENELKILQGYASQVSITADISQLDAAFVKAEAELKALGSQISLITIKGDSTQIDSTISKVESELMNLKAIPVPIIADASQLVTSVAQAENQLESIPPVEIPITANLSSIADIKKFIETNLRDVQGLQANININANTETFIAELRKAEEELKKIQSELGKVGTGSEFNRLSQNAKKLQTDIAGLKTQITATSGAINKMPQQLNSASYSITNLSRIVSDSAYGFIGIANNIGPFVDSLAAAKKEAQATGTSLGKNLLSSLSGPGGLSLAFAAVTTAITFAQIGFSAWSRSAKKAKDDTDNFAEGLKSAEQGALSQSFQFKELVKVIRDTTKTEKERNAALIEANRILEPYGKKIDSINISLAESKTLTDSLTTSLVNQAVALKIADKVAELTIKSREKSNDIKKQELYIDRLTTANAKSKVNQLTGQTAGYAELQSAVLELNVAKSEQKYIDKQIADLTDQYSQKLTTILPKTKAVADGAKKGVETLAQALDKFEKSLKATQATGISLGTPQFEINQDKIKEFEGILKKIIEKFNVDPNNKVYLGLEARLNELNYENLLLKIKSKLEGAAKAILLPWDWKPKSENEIPIPNIAKNIKPVVIPIKVKAELEAIQGDIVPPEFVNNVKEQLKGSADEIKKAWKDYSTQIDNAATGFLTDAAANIAIKFGEALGAALTGGNFGDVFKGVFELLAGGIQSLGEQLIKIGLLAVIAQQALAQLLANPFAAIGVGIALVALGAALKNLTTQKRFATGTRYAPGGMALVGERGPEMINLPRGSQVIPAAQTSQMMGGIGGQVEVFGVLRGQDIFFSNKKYGQTYGRTT